MTTLRHSTKITTLVLLLGASSVLTGCGAGVAPESLHTARDAYKKAEASPAPQLAPVQLDAAKQSLTRAEEAFKNGEKDEDVKDLSYVAQKRAEVAVSAANREKARREGEQAKSDKDTVQQALLNSTQDKLSQTSEALRSEQQRADEDA